MGPAPAPAPVHPVGSLSPPRGAGGIPVDLSRPRLPCRLPPSRTPDSVQAPVPAAAAPPAQVKRAGRTALPTVSVIIPTFNEAENLGWVLPRLPASASEVIVVDGGSTDGTVAAAIAQRPDAIVMTHPRRGKGNALATGFAAATGDVIVMLDADGSADPLEIPKFVEALQAGYDFAKGTRFAHGGGSADITAFRRLGNTCFVRLVNLLFGAQYSDLCYGLNAFWRRCLPDVMPDCDGFEVETLMNLRLVRSGLRVQEVGSYEYRRRSGISKLHSIRDGSRIFRTIVGERLRRSSPATRIEVQVAGAVVPRLASGSLDRVPRGIRIALVNNMPDPAFLSTDSQFSGLLARATPPRLVQIERFSLPGLRRSAATAAAMTASGYRPVSELFASQFDALYITGTEPITDCLSDEPYWTALTQLLEWGLAHSQSIVLSCLAAHAALQFFDGLTRERRARKCFGIVNSTVTPGSRLLHGLPPDVRIPHSHWNDVGTSAALAHGYSPLLTAGEHWTAMEKRVGGCHILLYQGHPEYDPLALLREFRRDWRRFHNGGDVSTPRAPRSYLDDEGSFELRALESLAGRGPNPALADSLPFDRLAAHVTAPWLAVADRLYSNWADQAAVPEAIGTPDTRPLRPALARA